MAASPSKTLHVGDFAPDFSLRDQHGDIVRLGDYRNKKSVVLYFYPKDDTPGCTLEAKCFRDNYEIFLNQNAEVIGVSSDSAMTHIRFANKHQLPFILLSDITGKVRELYGIPRKLLILPGRVTFIIDKEGRIRNIFSSQFNIQRHIDEALETLSGFD
jgi:thioredoxin-dependent peroxiredoxin